MQTSEERATAAVKEWPAAGTWRDSFQDVVDRGLLTPEEADSLALHRATLESVELALREEAREAKALANGSEAVGTTVLDRQLVEVDEIRQRLRRSGLEAVGDLAERTRTLLVDLARANLDGRAALRVSEPDEAHSRVRKVDGASFAFDQPENPESIWGTDDEVVWMPGESLLVVGPDGVGKTTKMQQLWLARAGLRDELLGLPVTPAEGVCVYLAMDRPAQAARSFRRMVDEEQAGTLRERLAVWKGPLPINVLEHPWTFADWIQAEFPLVSDIFIDSLKDLAPKLSEDETGSKLNMARQELLARGLQMVEGHHQRKEQRGQGAPKTLADVYGSRWLTAGAGSVLLLWGEPGDPVVELLHLKQPLEPFGPHRVIHDHRRGRSELYEPGNLLETIERTAGGMLVADAARALYETSATPTPSQVEKARRKLNKLVEKGQAERRDDPDGTARYFGRSAP
jgi:hypothetical protein